MVIFFLIAERSLRANEKTCSIQLRTWWCLMHNFILVAKRIHNTSLETEIRRFVMLAAGRIVKRFAWRYLHLDPIKFLIFLHDVNAVYFLWIFINQNSFLQVEYIQSKNISKWVFSFGYMHVNFSRAETIYRSLQDG